MSQQEEKRQAQREKGHELCVRRRHAVTLAVHLFRPLLLQKALQAEIQRFAGHLAAEHQEDLDFARRPDQRGVDDAEPLRHERQPGAEVGNGIVRILEMLVI